jgi:hypothetical protein
MVIVTDAGNTSPLKKTATNLNKVGEVYKIIFTQVT